jgi:hypothetical protein
MAEAQIAQLKIVTDDESGQLLRLIDTEIGREIVRFEPGEEFALNQRPLRISSVAVDRRFNDHRTVFDAEDHPMYKAGRRYRLTRHIVPGGTGPHVGRRRSLSLRVAVRRVPWGDWRNDLDQVWGPPIETPLYLETVTLLAAKTAFFGPNTRMRAVAIGGSGPRDHVSYEDGPVDEVVSWLRTGFRTSFPGQQSIPGALYYDPADERWLWIFCRHPHVGGQIEFEKHRQAFRFGFFRNLDLNREVITPDVTIHYGQGLDEAEAVLAEQFDLYEEPPDWWYHTTWFWLHPQFQKHASFDNMAEAIRILMDGCGVNGFGLVGHDIPLAGCDVEPRSYRASPYMGSDDGLRRAAELISSKGGHSYMWYTRSAAMQGTAGNGGFRDAWALKGEDGRPVYVDLINGQMCNSLHPDYQAYVLAGLAYYVRELGITGIFWDSAFQPLSPDFSDPDGAYMDCPGEAMAGPPVLYEKAYRLGRSLSKDFFMWGEGLSTECRMNGFAVDNRRHGEKSGHLLMHRIAHAGPRRLVWRSAWPHDVAGAMPFISPFNDAGRDIGPAFYRKIAASPMNQWLCRTVKERGCRQAVGIADGTAVLDEFVIVADHEELCRRVVVPDKLLRGRCLIHEVSGARVEGEQVAGGMAFDITETGAWKQA